MRTLLSALVLLLLAAATPADAVGKAGAHPVAVPPDGRAVGTANPDHVVGHGTPASCTSGAVVRAVAAGGVVTFNCGPDPVVIAMKKTAKVRNDHGKRVVIDGGGLVTLDGGGKRRILYQNTCDPKQVWTTSHCNDQATPRLVVQNITLAHGKVSSKDLDAGSGGAIYARGGRLKIVNARFVGNRCTGKGPDVGGAAVRALNQFGGKPVYLVHTTFRGGRCANGAALSSIGVSWVVLNSVFRNNKATGHGANAGNGGNGGAIYLDGNRFTLRLGGTLIEDNHANEGGGAVFFVSNDRTGTMRIDHSTLRRNKSAGFETSGLPGIFFLGAHRPTIKSSVLR